MGDVDEEFEGQPEAVFHQAGGKEYSLGGAECSVAMADGAIAQLDVVRGRNHGLAGVGDRKGNEVVGAILECGGKQGGHAAHQALKVGLADARFAPSGETDAVGPMGNVNLRGDFLRRPEFDLRAARHEPIF